MTTVLAWIGIGFVAVIVLNLLVVTVGATIVIFRRRDKWRDEP